jgi:protein-disulfide isomerase
MESSNTGTSQFFEKYGTALALLVGLVVIGGAIYFGRGEGAPQGGAAPEPVAVDIADVKKDTGPSVGSMDAPVVIAAWFDYQCGHCQNFEKTTMLEVYEKYVASGKVRILYKDYQFFGDESDRLSAFGRALYEAHPASFHAWMQAAMAAQADKAFGSDASIEALAATIPGVNVERVKALVAQKGAEYAAAASADQQEGASFGITGTPGSIVGTTLISGSRPFSFVGPLIEAELAR